MISVEEARNIVNSQIVDWGVEYVSISDTIGRVLAEDVVSDRDFPPFDRVAMDGICLSFDDFESGQRRFKVQGIQYAGEPALKLTHSGNTIEIMTGAVLSTGTDIVVRYEDVAFEELEGVKYAIVQIDETHRWNNIHRQGVDNIKGSLLVAKGSVIHAGIVAILATVGQSKVAVKRLPKVAIISTGNELVDVDQVPLSHQIRKSNTISIQSVLNQHNIFNRLFHLLDDKEQLHKALQQILADFDVLMLSGGVSKGKADYLPEVLSELWVHQLFHQVAQRPGKPLWFGRSNEGKPVFAFPGNPISTWMCFRIYGLPWILKYSGIHLPIQTACLSEDFTFKAKLGYFLQVSTKISPEGLRLVTPQVGNGSGDLANLADSDAFIYIPFERIECKKGESFEYFPFSLL